LADGDTEEYQADSGTGTGPERAGAAAEQAGRRPEPAEAEAAREPAEAEAAREPAEAEAAAREPEAAAREPAEAEAAAREPEAAAREPEAAAREPPAVRDSGSASASHVKSRAERIAARDAAAGTDRPIVVDATNHVAGRLASNVAKLLLKGNRVSIVNCERIMISGTRSSIVGEYKQFLEIASILHPKHGPFHPRRPDTMITRMIRGMLPRKKPSGRAAHRRLRAYIGAPKDLGAYKRVRFEKAMITRPASGYTTMASLGDAIGWTR